LLQDEIVPLAERLLAAKYEVMIETAGNDSSEGCQRSDQIVDVKCPDCGGNRTRSRCAIWRRCPGADEVKSCSPRGAIMNLRAIYSAARLARRGEKQVLFSPFSRTRKGSGQASSRRMLVEWILADGLPVRLGLQLHKFIWDPATKGV